MKLSTKKASTLQSTTGCSTSKKFVIGDSAVIIDILRSRLYSHPLRTSIQEYISNARDANRESKTEKPIIVTLPNKLDPVFKVRDFGLGLSPERVEEVFVKYGVSTKRTDNTQTGGFGIGAKSAWAYTDSFTVISFFQGKKYTYIAHLGGENSGSMDLLDEENSLEESGVEISFGVKSEDIDSAIKAVYRSTQFWAQHPELRGITQYEIPTAYENKGFQHSSFSLLPTIPSWLESAQEKKHSDLSSLTALVRPGELQFNKKTPSTVWALVDGIPYDVSKAVFSETRHAFFGNIFLPFNTGDIQINANREEVVFTPEVNTLLNNRTTAALEVIKAELIKKIQSTRTLKSLFRVFKDGHPLNASLRESFSSTFNLQGRDVTVRHEGEGNFSLILPDNDLYCTPNFTQPTRTIPLSFENIKQVLTLPNTEDQQRLLRHFYNEYEFGGAAKVILRSVAVVYTREPSWYEGVAASESKTSEIKTALENHRNLQRKRTRLQETLKKTEPPRKTVAPKKLKGTHLLATTKIVGEFTQQTGLKLQRFDLFDLKDSNKWVYLLGTSEEVSPGTEAEKVLLAKTYYANNILKKKVVLLEQGEESLYPKIESLDSLFEKKKTDEYKEDFLALCYNQVSPGFIKNLIPHKEILKKYWNTEEREVFEEIFDRISFHKEIDGARKQAIELMFSKEIHAKSLNIKNNITLLERWIDSHSFLRVINYRMDVSDIIEEVLSKYYPEKD